MKKIGFFGGSFNPPTIAHFMIAKASIKEFGLDKLVIVPMGDKYEKSELISFNLRYEMLKIAFRNIHNIEISKMQQNQQKKTYAIDSFREISKKYDKTENYFIMGLDNYLNINKWKDSEELLNNFKYIVFKRNDIEIPEFAKNASFLDIYYNISSSDVRKMIKYKENLKEVLNEDVVDFIRKNNLYNQEK